MAARSPLPADGDEDVAAGFEAHAPIANMVIAKEKTRNRPAGCAIIGDTPIKISVQNTPRDLNSV
jgi:hypothetical protein